jgi:hypothetical protein
MLQFRQAEAETAGIFIAPVGILYDDSRSQGIIGQLKGR